MTLGGKTYEFLWGTRAIREMQEFLSTPDKLVSLDEILAQIRAKRLHYMCAFVWAGLLKHNPEIKFTDVDEIMDSATEAELEALRREFFGGLTPSQADLHELGTGRKKNPRKARAKASTGVNSISTPEALA